ncbi:hypothetical protein Tco_1237217 [Tanacetum coccineum]
MEVVELENLQFLSSFLLEIEPLSHDKLNSGDKSLDLSAFKLSRLFFSLLSLGSSNYWRIYGAHNACPKRADRQGGNVRGQAYVIRDAEHNQDPNIVNEREPVIVCGKKEVHVPYENKTLVVKSDSGASGLKVISCIKARKYIERGSQLFLAQVTEKEPSKKQLQDVPVIRNFPEVFPDDKRLVLNNVVTLLMELCALYTIFIISRSLLTRPVGRYVI